MSTPATADEIERRTRESMQQLSGRGPIVPQQNVRAVLAAMPEDPNDSEVRLRRLQKTGEANAAAIQEETAERESGERALTDQIVALQRDMRSLRSELRDGVTMPTAPAATTAYNWKAAQEVAWAAVPVIVLTIGAAIDQASSGMDSKDMLLWGAALAGALWRAVGSKIWSALTTREPVLGSDPPMLPGQRR